MKPMCLLLAMFVMYETVSANPVLREVATLLDEFEPEEKIREKRKSGLLDHLQAEGIGVKKAGEGEVIIDLTPKSEETHKVEVPPELEGDVEEGSTRAKKQTHDHVCIQDMSNGGKTSCGRVISARGPSAKMLVRADPGMPDVESKMDRYQSMQSRTFDPLIPLTSLTSSVAYAVPTTSLSAADTTATLTHSLPAIAAAPALPVAPIAPVAHLESLPLITHSLPIHPMHTMFAHRPLLNLNLQRMELPKLQEIIYTPAEVKQPAYEVKPIVTRPVATAPTLPFLYSSRYGSVNAGYDGPMICHPLGDERASQQVIQIRPEVHVIESGPKNLNASVEEFKSQLSDTIDDDDEKKVREHLRKVNEIREEITQLNKAAQKIVDQQERLAEMQQRHLWRSAEKAGYQPYNDLRMYMVPPTYTRANALAYPNAADDIEFFMNLLKAGKNLGALSNSFQPVINSALDTTKLVFGNTNGQNQNSQSKTNTEKNGQSTNSQSKSGNTKQDD